MTDEPENLTLKLLREMRADIQERDEKRAADIARVHADVARQHSDVIARLTSLERDVTQVHADVLATKALCLEAVVKLTALERRVAALEPKERV